MVDNIECYHTLIIAILLDLSPEDARKCYETGKIPMRVGSKRSEFISPRAAIRESRSGKTTREVLEKFPMSRSYFYRWKERIEKIDAEESRQHRWECERRRYHSSRNTGQINGQISIFDFELPPDPSIDPKWLEKL